MRLSRGGTVLVSVLAARIQAARIDLHVDNAQEVLGSPKWSALPSSWNLTDQGIRNTTSNFIFDTANTFLQHWTHTRYRNGHNLVPGVVPVGTLLYHGTYKHELPKVPEWLATDPEHSYLFCREHDGTGCWHLTLVATRPLKVLYFDGSSAAKMLGGPMDTQDLVGWGEIRPEWVFQERKRVDDLCEWGKRYGLGGFVRMEMDFEVMLCDFTTGVQTVSFLNLKSSGFMRGPRPPRPSGSSPPSPPPTSSPVNPPPSSLHPHGNGMDVRVLESGSWHNGFPGESRVKLDYSRLISFYDESTFPSLRAAREGQERWDHRLAGISKEDVQTMFRRLGELLKGWDGRVEGDSGVDWQTLLKTVAERYDDRLEVLQYILNVTEVDDARDVLDRAHSHVDGLLAPYVLHSSVPPKTPTEGYTWAEPVFEQCSTTHTSYLDSDVFQSVLTPSERLLLSAVNNVSKEICRILVLVWAEGEELGLSDAERDDGLTTTLSVSEAKDVLAKWTTSVESLMGWLDWSYWVKCRPACSYEEMCYLPTWPFFGGGPRGPRPPKNSDEDKDRYSSKFLNWVWGLESSVPPGLGSRSVLPGGGDDDWSRPQPRCIRRMEPYAGV
ncbi:unnamed protein product [Cyclocybe aegerita]|uniref:Uncharacterized protein n=1 Tax=Cyclocybe aegerita TaxID=1973307 RepID=A0A8S0XX47_CYCAE|nr:unnamed protein product [Cyclocybe aegerita]